jgi:hypothetical protein
MFGASAANALMDRVKAPRMMIGKRMRMPSVSRLAHRRHPILAPRALDGDGARRALGVGIPMIRTIVVSGVVELALCPIVHLSTKMVNMIDESTLLEAFRPGTVQVRCLRREWAQALHGEEISWQKSQYSKCRIPWQSPLSSAFQPENRPLDSTKTPF